MNRAGVHWFGLVIASTEGTNDRKLPVVKI